MTNYRGLIVPRRGKERLMNEEATMRYIREMTNIPVPTVRCTFEDDEAYYLYHRVHPRSTDGET